MYLINPWRFGITGPGEIEYLATYTPTVSGSDYSFLGVDTGPSDPRKVMFIVVMLVGSYASTVNSMTFNGEAVAPFHVMSTPVETYSGAFYRNYIFSHAQTSGALADIVVDASISGTTFTGLRLFVYRAINISSQSPIDTKTASSHGPSVSVNLDVKGGGVAIAAAMLRLSPYTWTGINKNYDISQFTGGCAEFGADATVPITVVDSVGSPSAGVLYSICAASFR